MMGFILLNYSRTKQLWGVGACWLCLKSCTALKEPNICLQNALNCLCKGGRRAASWFSLEKKCALCNALFFMSGLKSAGVLGSAGFPQVPELTQEFCAPPLLLSG